jgi:hypothetical protein
VWNLDCFLQFLFGEIKLLVIGDFMPPRKKGLETRLTFMGWVWSPLYKTKKTVAGWSARVTSYHFS